MGVGGAMCLGWVELVEDGKLRKEEALSAVTKGHIILCWVGSREKGPIFEARHSQGNCSRCRKNRIQQT